MCGSGPARAEGRFTNASFSGVEIMDEIHDPYVWCGTCCLRTRSCDSISEAIVAWNTRTPSLHREPIEADREADEQVRAIINRHAEYMNGLDRGQQFFRAEAVIAMVREALALSTPAASDAEAMLRSLENCVGMQSNGGNGGPSFVKVSFKNPGDQDAFYSLVSRALPLPKAGEIETETAFEVWEDDLMVASASTEAEGLHYFAVYSQDGPVKLVRAETVRQVIATPSTEGRKGEGQADG